MVGSHSHLAAVCLPLRDFCEASPLFSLVTPNCRGSRKCSWARGHPEKQWGQGEGSRAWGGHRTLWPIPPPPAPTGNPGLWAAHCVS